MVDRYQPRLAAKVLEPGTAGIEIPKFWQNEAKIINLFRDALSPIRGADRGTCISCNLADLFDSRVWCWEIP